MPKYYVVFMLTLLFSSASWADEPNTPPVSRVDQILAQIDTLSGEEQSELVKKLVAQKTDQAIADAKEKVNTVKKQIQSEMNDPKYQKHLDKAKRKLKKLYDLFHDDAEVPEALPQAI